MNRERTAKEMFERWQLREYFILCVNGDDIHLAEGENYAGVCEEIGISKSYF